MALVGNSGGGKSTIVNLIPRFYKIKQGKIKIDGIDIADYKIESLRNNISIVLQDNFLFAGTIKENILMGKPNATDEELNTPRSVRRLCVCAAVRCGGSYLRIMEASKNSRKDELSGS